VVLTLESIESEASQATTKTGADRRRRFSREAQKTGLPAVPNKFETATRLVQIVIGLIEDIC